MGSVFYVDWEGQFAPTFPVIIIQRAANCTYNERNGSVKCSAMMVLTRGVNS